MAVVGSAFSLVTCIRSRADCKSAIPGSNPGGASSVSSTIILSQSLSNVCKRKTSVALSSWPCEGGREKGEPKLWGPLVRSSASGGKSSAVGIGTGPSSATARPGRGAVEAAYAPLCFRPVTPHRASKVYTSARVSQTESQGCGPGNGRAPLRRAKAEFPHGLSALGIEGPSRRQSGNHCPRQPPCSATAEQEQGSGPDGQWVGCSGREDDLDPCSRSHLPGLFPRVRHSGSGHDGADLTADAAACLLA